MAAGCVLDPAKEQCATNYSDFTQQLKGQIKSISDGVLDEVRADPNFPSSPEDSKNMKVLTNRMHKWYGQVLNAVNR